MDFVELSVRLREETGKEKVKKMRAEGEIPAVLYGSKSKNELLAINAKDFNYLDQHGKLGGVLKLKTEGDNHTQNVIIKDVQKDPVSDKFLHIDFLKVIKGEAITTIVPITLLGEAPGVKTGGVLQHNVWELNIKALPKNLPTKIEVDISSLEVGELVRVADLSLPEGVEVLNSPEEVMVSVVPPTKIEEPEAVSEKEEVTEPEIIGEEKKEEKEEEEEKKE
ncbi:50S ribosomal protein L25 [Candidatus Oleimmundimicrobium sp.]|uniref:50S ribosomal protein L25 n=1 Tax=Candidatus Oleimmundimicrobium sp. TaxID=3060597 RepID=UPI002719593F|nr:50S ribosomal protein L25 [Candidatus Oleimmundimicrobium sp.]MDO8886299.1 50S ribosomal protein L25 [Candidatus Oleimmundimicrobium sp.]